MLIISYKEKETGKDICSLCFQSIRKYERNCRKEKMTGNLYWKTEETAISKRKTRREKVKIQEGKKEKREGESWEIAWQSPIEHWILNCLDPEGCNNNTGDNNNQRSQYHVIHDFTLRFQMSERNAPF